MERLMISSAGRVGSQVVIPFRGNEYDYNQLKVMGDLGQMLFFVSMKAFIMP